MRIIKNNFDIYINNYINIHNNTSLKHINNLNDFNNLIIYGAKA